MDLVTCCGAVVVNPLQYEAVNKMRVVRSVRISVALYGTRLLLNKEESNSNELWSLVCLIPRQLRLGEMIACRCFCATATSVNATDIGSRKSEKDRFIF